MTVLEKQEMQYINHMGAYAAGTRVVMTGSFGHKVATQRPIATPNVVELLENYIKWADWRDWGEMDGRMLKNHAVNRLARIRRERGLVATGVKS